MMVVMIYSSYYTWWRGVKLSSVGIWIMVYVYEAKWLTYNSRTQFCAVDTL